MGERIETTPPASDSWRVLGLDP